jgi:hypothetical protein
VAQRLKVRLNANITEIQRGQFVSVAWNEKDPSQPLNQPRGFREEFDLLVVACPPGATSSFLDWSEAEARLFSEIQTLSYAVTICECRGLPENIGFIESPLGPGHLIQFWKPSPGSGPCAFYTSPLAGMTVDEILPLLRDDMKRFYPDATIGKVLGHQSWSYFPHVNPDAFARGYFDDFEAIQGTQSTWYAGSLLSFESVENVVVYSESLVERIICGIP